MQRTLLNNDSFKLGLFSANCSGGLAVTKIPNRWSASWEDNLAMARLADAVGIDFLLPIARWIGYKGDTNFHGHVLDPIVWASALLASTHRINVFATVHTSFNHPMVIAKQLATLDQLGGGQRAGLNVVAGWNLPEYEALGTQMPHEHDDRYGFAEEWLEVVLKAWSSPAKFQHQGAFFKLKDAESEPKPQGSRVPILNAGSSVQGRDFAAKNSDFVFTIIPDTDTGSKIVSDLRFQAMRDYQREVGVLTLGHVVCRESRAEADEFMDYYAQEHADWGAVDYLMSLQGMHAHSFTPEMLQTMRERFASGHGSLPIVGTPEDVAEQIREVHRAGFNGMTLAFVDYIGELDHFARKVMPILERMGIRQPKVRA